MRRHAHPGCGDEFLDVPPVQLHAVGQANGVHHLDLQRNDGHGRPRLRQQLQRAIEQRVVQDGFVQLCIALHGGGRWAVWCGGRHRHWQAGFGNGGCSGAVQCVEQRLLFLIKGSCGCAAQLQGLLEMGQEFTLGRRLAAIHIAHAHGHFVGELAVGGVLQRCGG